MYVYSYKKEAGVMPRGYGGIEVYVGVSILFWHLSHSFTHQERYQVFFSLTKGDEGVPGG